MHEDFRAIVLHSGGIDSTSALAIAKDLYGADHVLSVGLDYGQKHRVELKCAERICEHMGIQRHIITLPTIANSALTEADQDVPDKKYSDIEGVSPAYVPFRNGYFLSAAASLAQSLGASRIYIGAHAEDAERDAYPDCTLEFIGAMAAAVYVGTYHQVRIVAPFLAAEKHEVVRRGYVLKAPLHMSWSCYRGGEYHCGHCMTCYARKEAFSKAAIIDPTTYVDDVIRTQGQEA